MAVGLRPSLGLALQDSIMGTQQPTMPNIPVGTPPIWGGDANMPPMTPGAAPVPQKPGFFGEGGLGRILAGAVGDGLLQQAGMQPVYAPMQRERMRDEREQVQWGLRRRADLQDYEAKQQIEQKYRQPDVSPMVRDAQAWARMTPEMRTAYGQMKQAGAGDPDVFITLPDGRAYAGPKSGLATALTGGAAPNRPAIGAVVPDPRKGGAGSQAPYSFRP